MIKPYQLVWLMLLSACDNQESGPTQLELVGDTMGTTFSVSFVPNGQKLDKADLEREIKIALTNIESSMSTYDSKSDLSTFNQNQSTSWFPVPMELCNAVATAIELGQFTDGNFDITIGPAVNLWGFGPSEFDGEPPSEAALRNALQNVGYEKLQTDCNASRIRKTDAGVYVDLSGYAKGLAVDNLADIFNRRNIENFLIEIGGEIRVRGESSQARLWRIAIEKPINNERTVEHIIEVPAGAVATSGDYRNYFDFEDQRYSHAINSKTGRPVTHNLASVTVVGTEAARADALATALLVMGPNKGPEFAKQHSIAALFLIRETTYYSEQLTPEFEELLVN